MSLRSTTIRDVKGTVWHVPNGEIARIGNYSQIWSRALIDVEVAYDTDLRLAMGVMQRVADELWGDPDWGGDELMERPEVWGIQSLGASGVAIRVVVKTEPSMQWSVRTRDAPPSEGGLRPSWDRDPVPAADGLVPQPGRLPAF